MKNRLAGIALAIGFAGTALSPGFQGIDAIGAAAARVVTRGADGCESLAPGRAPVRADAFRVKAVDTTAAGDTFTGYYLAALAAGADEASALRRASAAAAIAVTRPGAAPSVPVAAEVDDFLAARG